MYFKVISFNIIKNKYLILLYWKFIYKVFELF